MTGWLDDVRQAARSLRRRPGTFAPVVVLLALAIGGITAVFSLVDAVLLRPLPFAEPDRLAWIWSTRVDRPQAFFALPELLDYRERTRSFARLCGFTPADATLTGRGDPERLPGVRATANVFDVLGIVPAAGRALAASDGEPGAPPCGRTSPSPEAPRPRRRKRRRPTRRSPCFFSLPPRRPASSRPGAPPGSTRWPLCEPERGGQAERLS